MQRGRQLDLHVSGLRDGYGSLCWPVYGNRHGHFGPPIFEIPGAPGQFRGQLLAFDAHFVITSEAGTVDGTKTLVGQPPADAGNAGVCLVGPPDNQAAQVLAASLTYSATISTTDGTYTDEGAAFADFNAYSNPTANSPQLQFREGFFSGIVTGPPASLVLSPAGATNTVGQQHCVTATVKDSSDNPTSGIAVVFSVGGVNSANGAATTDADGHASFCYTGTHAGGDTIGAFADTDGSGVQNGSEPTGSAAKTWTAPAAAADLSVSKSDSPDPVNVGSTLTYTITVKNNGPQSAQSVKLVDTLPGGLTYLSTTTSRGSCSRSGAVVTCQLGTLASGATATIKICVKTTVAGTVTNTAVVSSSTSDPNGANNTDSELTTVQAPQQKADLSVSKSDSPDPVNVGSTLTYTITVKNNGPQSAQSVKLVDTLPGGLTYLSTTTSRGSCSRSGAVVTCQLGTLASGATATIKICVKTTVAGTVTNTAVVSSSTSDPNGANNTDTEATTVKRGYGH